MAASANGVEERWAQLSATIHASTADTVEYERPRCRPWISNETLEAVDRKAAARLANDTNEWRRLCCVVRAKTKADRESYYNRLADEAEEGPGNNQLKGAYRAIKQISGKASASHQRSINKVDGQPCVSKKETLARWQEHYTTMLNHPPATSCPDLDRDAASASEATDVCSDSPSLHEVWDAIARLKNGRAAGPDGIPPELLKCTTGPIATALRSLILMVWREGRVPAEWKDGIITALYKGKGSKAD